MIRLVWGMEELMATASLVLADGQVLRVAAAPVKTGTWPIFPSSEP